jgi:hypothetical protein
LFVACYRINAAPAVGECTAVSRHHQRRVALGDELERCQIAAEGISVESTLEREEVVAGEEESVGRRPQADMTE